MMNSWVTDHSSFVIPHSSLRLSGASDHDELHRLLPIAAGDGGAGVEPAAGRAALATGLGVLADARAGDDRLPLRRPLDRFRQLGAGHALDHGRELPRPARRL